MARGCRQRRLGSPSWVKGGKTLSEHMFSELPQIADIVVPVGSRESVETALPDLGMAMDLDPSFHMELGHALRIH